MIFLACLLLSLQLATAAPTLNVTSDIHSILRTSNTFSPKPLNYSPYCLKPQESRSQYDSWGETLDYDACAYALG